MLFRTVLLSTAMVTGLMFVTADAAFARRGADDAADHVRQGRGADDPVGDVRRGRGADDPVGHDANDDRGGARAAGASGRNGADDPADHDANDDHGVHNPPEVENEPAGDRQRGRGRH